MLAKPFHALNSQLICDFSWIIDLWFLFFTFCSYNNRKKTLWKFLNLFMLGLFFIRLDGHFICCHKYVLHPNVLFCLCSLGCTIVFFLASYDNYPSGNALKDLHQIGESSFSFFFSCRHMH
jgi:hypothetical protein